MHFPQTISVGLGSATWLVFSYGPALGWGVCASSVLHLTCNPALQVVELPRQQPDTVLRPYKQAPSNTEVVTPLHAAQVVELPRQKPDAALQLFAPVAAHIRILVVGGDGSGAHTCLESGCDAAVHRELQRNVWSGMAMRMHLPCGSPHAGGWVLSTLEDVQMDFVECFWFVA